MDYQTRGTRQQRANFTGPEMVSKLRVGTRVMRGPDWKWGDQVSSTGRGVVRLGAQEEVWSG